MVWCDRHMSGIASVWNVNIRVGLMHIQNKLIFRTAIQHRSDEILAITPHAAPPTSRRLNGEHVDPDSHVNDLWIE